MPRLNIDRIAEMAASTWTGSPPEVFYDMYYGNKSFNDSMEDFSGMLLSQYEDEDMALAYADDEFAVEKAAYQIEMAGSTDAEALASVGGMLTPWGPGFDMPQEIEAIIEEYPGITVGFNANTDDDVFTKADAIAGHPTFMQAVDDIEERAEDEGLLGDVKNILRGVGDWLGENVYENLGELGEGITNAIGDNFEKAGERTLLNQLGNQAAWEETWTQGVSEQTNNKFMELEDKAMTREYFQVLDDILKDEGPAGLKAYIGDERNYQTGELDLGMVNEWLTDQRAKTSGGPAGAATVNKWNMMQGWQNAVDAIEFSADQVAKDVTSETAQATPQISMSIPGEEEPSRPYNWMPYNPYLGPVADEGDEYRDDTGGLTPLEQMLDRATEAGDAYRKLVEEEEDGGLWEEEEDDEVDDTELTEATTTEEIPVTEEDVDAMLDKFGEPLKGYPDYQTRFLNAFNQREGSGRYDYRQLLPELYEDAEMLYYLTEPWSAEGRPGEGGLGPTLVLKEGLELPEFVGEDVDKEHDHFTNWANAYMDNPRTKRNMFFDAAESLRDNMAGFIGKSYEDQLADGNTQYQRMLFMDPSTKGSFSRTARLVADYNLPPDADPWLKQRMRSQMAQNLESWEASGKTREEFLVTFMQERPY